MSRLRAAANLTGDALALTRVGGLRGPHKDDEHRQDHVQRAVYPPSITSSLPVTNFASSDAR